jgi:hypothetical protein
MFLRNGCAACVIAVALAFASTERGAAEPAKWPCEGRCIDAAWIANLGFAYFAKGDQVWRYDIARNKVSFVEVWDNYPKPMRKWPGFPQAWSSGIDTALNAGNGKVYFFKEREFIRFDIASGRVDAGPNPIAANWLGLPQQWSSGFDAAVNWGNGKVYFFKGRDYLAYDIASKKASDPQPIAGNLRGLPETWASGIDAAVNWGNGKAYLFKADQYVSYDISNDRVDSGYPKPIASNWPGLVSFIEWVNWPAQELPASAMSVGREADDRSIFLCAAVVGNAIYPGKTWAATKSCSYSDGKREVKTGIYAVATTVLSIAWSAKSAASDKLIPVGVSPAGRTYYLCRARFGNGVQPGRIEGNSGGCTIADAGRSQTVNDGVEIASAPTVVNFLYMPQFVSMLRALPGSDRFKDVCGAEVTYKVLPSATGAHYPPHYPDMKTLFTIIARNDCAMLYKNPGEVPRYARKLEVVLENEPGNQADGHEDTHEKDARISILPRNFPATGINQIGILGLFYHETTHAIQHIKADGQYAQSINEGVADLLALKLLEQRVSKREDEWRSGYQAVAYFFDWLEGRYPDFVYQYNMSRSRGRKWSIDEIAEITGKPIDTLWQEYREWLLVTLPQPESLLKWPAAVAAVAGTWEFGRQRGTLDHRAGKLCQVTLTLQTGPFGNRIMACDANESYWSLEGDKLIFKNEQGQATTTFLKTNANQWEGPFVVPPTVHYISR